MTALRTVLKERKEYSEKDGSFEHATLSKDGIYGKTARYDRDFLVSTENKKYKVTHYGDLCYNPANLKFGVICLNKYGDAIFSPIYVTFEIQPSYDQDFIGTNLSRWDFINQALRYQEGTVYERMAVSPEDFVAIRCYLPSYAEQVRISVLTRLLDERIEKQRAYVECLKKYKRGLSDAMFDSIARMDTTLVAPFNSIFTLLQNNTFSREDMTFDTEFVKNIHYGDVLIKYGAVVNLSTTPIPSIKPDRRLDKYADHSYLQNGDIVFADTAEDYSVGKATEISGISGQQVLAGLHTIPCRPKTSFAPAYLGYYFNSSYFKSQILPMVQGTKVSSISKTEMLKTSVLIPQKMVQEKVASTLYKLDCRIDFEERMVAALVQEKQGLLQRLFI